MASSLVHDPAVLLLDEPFNGMDPRQRMHLMELLRTMGAEGRTVLFSSHILEEVEQVARQIEVVVAGRHAASGDFGAIRRLMTDRPNRFVLRTGDDRTMASDPAGRRLGPRRPAAVRGRHRDRGVRLRPVQRGAAAAGPRPRRPAARGHARPTSRWRASSPTWCRHERHLLADHRPARRPQRLRPPPRACCCSCCRVVLIGLAVLVRVLVGEDDDAASAHALRPRAGRGRAAGRPARDDRAAGARRSTTGRSPTCWPSRSRGTRSC